jgi:GntR family transcriptional regulator
VPSLNSDSPIPLYRQLADVLLTRIRAGEYPAGSKIPSEPQLSRDFRIGRPTVRQATDLLIRRRRLERRRGSGTFVVEPPEQVDLLSLAGTMASFEKTGLDVRTVLLRRPRRVRVEGDLENPFRGRSAWFVSRLTRVDKEPVLLERLWLDLEQFPDLGRISLADRSLSRLAEDHYHLRPESADQNFRVTTLDATDAEHLILPTGTPVLLVKRHIHFPNARSAVFAELTCRTDRLVFSQTLGGLPDA